MHDMGSRDVLIRRFPALIAPASLKRSRETVMSETIGLFSGVNCADLIETVRQFQLLIFLLQRFPALIAPASLKPDRHRVAEHRDRHVFRR